jgi:hypothetical protein
MNRRNIDTKAVAKQTGATIKPLLVGLLRLCGALVLTAGVAYAGYRAYGWLSRDARFAVRHLAFTGLTHAEQETLVRRAGIVAGTNIFALDLAAATLAMESDPWVARARLARELPNTLHVAITEHEPVAIATLAGVPFVIDAHGVPFKRREVSDHLDLPVLTGFSREALESRSSPLVHTALALLTEYEQGMAKRAPLGELALSQASGEPVWTAWCGEEPVAVRLGVLDGRESHEMRTALLGRLATVWDEIGRRGARAQSIDVGNRQRPEWVAARLK